MQIFRIIIFADTIFRLQPQKQGKILQYHSYRKIAKRIRVVLAVLRNAIFQLARRPNCHSSFKAQRSHFYKNAVRNVIAAPAKIAVNLKRLMRCALPPASKMM
ncbi:MAG: hypothetical protein ACK4IY_09665, partial [Chitinophagales bacterium]